MKQHFAVPTYLIYSIIILVILAVTSSCARLSRKLDISDETAPTILYVQTGKIVGDVYLATSSFRLGDKSNFKITLTDKDLDVRTLYIRRYQPKDADEPITRLKPIELKPQKEVRDSFFLETPLEITGMTGEWRLEVQVEDSMGNKSNAYKVFIIVH